MTKDEYAAELGRVGGKVCSPAKSKGRREWWASLTPEARAALKVKISKRRKAAWKKQKAT